MITTALAWILSPIGKVVAIGTAVIMLLAYVDQRGAARERAKCREAAVRAELQAKEVDAQTARQAADDAERENARISTELDSERRKVADYAAKLKARPECLLDDNDVGTGGVRKRTRRPTG